MGKGKCKHPEAIPLLLELRKKHGTWTAVSAELSQRIGKKINTGSVWRVANDEGNSQLVFDALGIKPKCRYRLCAELKSEENVEAVKLLLTEHDLQNLTQLINGLLQGKLRIQTADGNHSYCEIKKVEK